MGFFDDVFSGPHLFDSEYKQRRDIENLKSQIGPDYGPNIRELRGRVDRLELLCETLVEMLKVKGVATQGELATLMQQIDLLDGVEDGGHSKTVRADAPRCAECGRFVNPSRANCVYCGAAVTLAGSKDAGRPVELVECAECGRQVDAADTFISESGTLCSTCFFAE